MKIPEVKKLITYNVFGVSETPGYSQFQNKSLPSRASLIMKRASNRVDIIPQTAQPHSVRGQIIIEICAVSSLQTSHCHMKS
jgi:hypothetical protein